MQAAELVVVQDAFNNTDSNQYADVFLPASTWGEKEGTVTNSERRITRVEPAVAKPGEARHDWEIAVEFAQRLEKKLGNSNALFPYPSTESIFNEHRETTRGRDLDITGLSYELLVKDGPQQWPYVSGDQQGKARLYSDGKFATPNGKAKFVSAYYQPTADNVCEDYPLHLLTGRLRDQWHGMSRTGNVAQLYNHAESPVLSIHPDDLRQYGFEDGEIVRLRNARGELTIKLESSETVKPSETFMPMHWGGQFMRGAGVNALTTPEYDPKSKQPELKHTTIRLEKLALPWRMMIMRQCDDLDLIAKIRPFLQQFTYATCSLSGRDEQLIVFEAHHDSAPDPALIALIDALLNMMDDTALLQYDDVTHGINKRILIQDQRLTGVRLIGEIAAASWLKAAMFETEFSEEMRRWALSPLSAPPTGLANRGKIICNCLDVSENEIINTCQSGADLPSLQAQHKCGTQCGSCVPELKHLVETHFKAKAS